MRNIEPCLCGDPACGRCFPGGQRRPDLPMFLTDQGRKFDLVDAMYGLRNLATGDDEESRIEDYVIILPADLQPVVKELLRYGLYREAYITAIRPFLEPMSREAVDEAASAFVRLLGEGGWFVDENGEEETGEERASLKAEVMGMYDTLVQAEWT
jgi:hypothetical protein